MKTEDELLATKNFGQKSLNEIVSILATMGLELGMTFDQRDHRRVGVVGGSERREQESADHASSRRTPKTGRVTEHRIALLRNQATALLRHERITTTVAKAKELRPFVERLITVAKRGLADGTDAARAIHARRLVRRDVADTEVAAKLFETLAPRFAERPGGYTRLLRVGRRLGDDAEVAQIELVGSEYDPEQDEPKLTMRRGKPGRRRRASAACAASPAVSVAV